MIFSSVMAIESGGPNMGGFILVHPSLKGICMLWVCARESRQHPVLFDTKPDQIKVVILNFYGSFFLLHLFL